MPRHVPYLFPVLLWGLGACVGTSTPTRLGEGADAPATSASQGLATASSASVVTSSASAVASASARPPAEVKRLSPPSKQQFAGTCTAGAPIVIGKSAMDFDSGPEVAIAASTDGVVASWWNSLSETAVIALDDAGRPRGEGRTIASKMRFGSKMLHAPKLWEIGDGKLVLALEIEPSTKDGPSVALQRVDATGELVGSLVPFGHDHIMHVVPFKNQLLMATTDFSERELLRVSAREGGLEVKRSALPGPRDSSNAELVTTSSGDVWTIYGRGDTDRTIFREGSQSVKVKMPEDFRYADARSEGDELLWVSCGYKPTVPGLKLHDGKLVEVELPRSVCGEQARWSVRPDSNSYGYNNQGLLFQKDTLAPAVHLSKERRKDGWKFDATWTGARILVIYATGKAKDWTLFSHAVTCEAGAAPAASAPAPAR